MCFSRQKPLKHRRSGATNSAASHPNVDIFLPTGDDGQIMEKMRRLSDKIIASHLQACEEGKLDVAELLLQALQLDLTGRGTISVENREATEMVVAAFERHRDAKTSEDS